MRHEFVEIIPEVLEPDVLYVAIGYDTVVHSCFCGCGMEVVTPLSPAQWSLTYDGRSISLSPSIGNWNFPCKSHYWIRRGRVEWAKRLSEQKIGAVRAKDRADLGSLNSEKRPPLSQPSLDHISPEIEGAFLPSEQAEETERMGLFQRIWKIFS